MPLVTDTELDLFTEIVSQEEICCDLDDCDNVAKWVGSHNASCKILICDSHKRAIQDEINWIEIRSKENSDLKTYCLLCKGDVDLNRIQFVLI